MERERDEEWGGGSVEIRRSDVTKWGDVSSRALEDCETLWIEAVHRAMHLSVG